jgi:hypothetical protein
MKTSLSTIDEERHLKAIPEQYLTISPNSNHETRVQNDGCFENDSEPAGEFARRHARESEHQRRSPSRGEEADAFSGKAG